MLFLTDLLAFYFWLCWVFTAAHRLSLAAARWLLFAVVHRPPIVVAALVGEHWL